MLRAALSLTLSLLSTRELAPPRQVRVADGVFLFITPPYGDVGLDGNAVAVLSRDGVLVFDANGTPVRRRHHQVTVKFEVDEGFLPAL